MVQSNRWRLGTAGKWSPRAFITCPRIGPVGAAPPRDPFAFGWPARFSGPGCFPPRATTPLSASDRTHTGGRPGQRWQRGARNRNLRKFLFSCLDSKACYPNMWQFTRICRGGQFKKIKVYPHKTSKLSC